MLEERYTVSVATHNKAEALRLARLLYQQEPANLTRLDQLTWQLMQNEQSREAADLLLQRYPFQGDARVSQTLMARLASLLESHPYLATPHEGGDFIETFTAGGATSVAKSVAGYCR